jgi:hypothetical protein
MTEPIAEEVADFILALVKATSETTFLEPGVGTGLNVYDAPHCLDRGKRK